MIKTVMQRVWAFDAEWVPDPEAGRLLYDVPAKVRDPAEVMRIMWERGGATAEDPTPYLKTVLCRLVSIAAVERRVRPGGEVTLTLTSLPHDPADAEQASEAGVIAAFLDAVGRSKPQLVGYNSLDADLRILVQRGVVNGVRAPAFAQRPDKPWEGVDYFARSSDWNIDLRQVLGGYGRSVPSLHEIATLSGIPGKLDVDGNQVAELWLAGDLARIVEYNEFDALTTYLVWLRVAHFAGHFTPEEYAEEQERLRHALADLAPKRPHLGRYLEEWQRLRKATGRG